MPIIAFSNLKGGTGKTTSAIFIATALTRLGHSVQVLDADPQGSATEWAQRAEDNGEELLFEVLPANVRTLRRLPKNVDDNAWALIDCPPGDTGIIDASLAISDLVIIPTRPSSIEVERMWTTIELAGERPVKILLTSTITNTRSLGALKEALEEAEIPLFTVAIPQRELIKASYGAHPQDNLQGYAEAAEELIKELV